MTQLINEAKRFQKLANINEAEEIKSVDQIIDTPKVQSLGDKLANNPTLLQKAIGELTKLGIDKSTLEKAAQAYSSGKEVGSIIDDKVETASEKLNEISKDTLDNIKMGGGIGTFLGTMMGGIVGNHPSGIAMLAAAALIGLIGAGIGYASSSSQKESVNIESTVNEALAKVRKTRK